MLVVAMEDDILEKYWQCIFFEKDPEKKVDIDVRDIIEIFMT